MSAFTRLTRSPPDPRVRSLFERAPQARFIALKPLLGAAVLRDWLVEGEARFAVQEGEDVVLVIVNQTSFSIPGDQHADAWMFNLRGERMDHLETLCSTRDGCVWATFGEPGAELQLLAGPGFVKPEFFAGFILRQDGRPPRDILPGGPECPKDWLSKGLCRFRLAGGKFERIPP